MGNAIWDVKVRLMTVINKMFCLDLNDEENEYLDQNLFGNNFKLAPRDLVHLFFTIEKEFSITIPQEDIVEGKFNTFNNIVQIVEKQLRKKEKNIV